MTDAGSERQRVRTLIERAGVAVLMNVDEEGTQIGHPMLPLLVQNDPHIYFLTHQSSRKVIQLAARPHVGLSIISTNCFVVVASSAQLSREPELIRRLWSRRIALDSPRAKTIATPPLFAWQSNGSTTGNRRVIELSDSRRRSRQS